VSGAAWSVAVLAGIEDLPTVFARYATTDAAPGKSALLSTASRDVPARSAARSDAAATGSGAVHDPFEGYMSTDTNPVRDLITIMLPTGAGAFDEGAAMVVYGDGAARQDASMIVATAVGGPAGADEPVSGEGDVIDLDAILGPSEPQPAVSSPAQERQAARAPEEEINLDAVIAAEQDNPFYAARTDSAQSAFDAGTASTLAGLPDLRPASQPFATIPQTLLDGIADQSAIASFEECVQLTLDIAMASKVPMQHTIVVMDSSKLRITRICGANASFLITCRRSGEATIAREPGANQNRCG
jgi:hypothetical protein